MKRWHRWHRQPKYLGPYYPDRGQPLGRMSQSLAGVHWASHPLPRRHHLCWPQTRYYLEDNVPLFHCACGGWSLDAKHWIKKNQRRKRRHLLNGGSA